MKSTCSVARMAVIGVLAAAGCASTTPKFSPGEPLGRVGDEIVVCGQYFHTGAPVRLWTDPPCYDAYRVECRFNPERELPTKPAGRPSPNRYSSMRRHVPQDVQADVQSNGWSLPKLAEHVDQFVIHYDVCGTSRQCFKVLHDLRGLSVHFMLDLDGTIYQTLDLKERAWHAGTANDRSVGIEIANIGAYDDMETLDKWYAKDAKGKTYVTLPKWMGDGGIRTAGFVARPARNEPVEGYIHERHLMQYDLTPQQYDSLIKLTATLCQVLPKIRADYPRDAEGRLLTRVLSDEEFEAYSGLLGHYHVTKNKIDPGPAFDWDRVISSARKHMTVAAK